jgi:archaetidylinositol phosphate synthase
MVKAMASGPHTTLSRSNTGWLSPVERRALDWLTPRLPIWLTPNRLTAIGLLGCIISFIGYLIASSHPACLWLASAGLIVNWFGDSLDGSVARFRGIDRPRYGFFLDQSTDVIGQLLFSLGLGLSGYIRPEIVALGFAAYLMMTVQSLLRAQATGTFHLATGGMGLTEVRCLLLAANALFYFMPPNVFGIRNWSLAYSDLAGLLWIVVNVGLYMTNMFAELRSLARQENPVADKLPSSEN